ncbi:MAG: hypothetical protein WC178_05625 [Candidatus Paceibacterota bacterium]
MEKEDSKKDVNSGWELFKICLGSRTFDLLLVLMMMFVWCGIASLRDAVSGKDTTMSLLAIYVWPILIIVFFVVMFSGMKLITRGIKKSKTSVAVFAMIAAAIPVLMIIIL